jgi:DNA-binding NarL/FixJ family response regulator
MKSLWLVEDHAPLRNTLQHVFSKDPDFTCSAAFGNAAALLAALQHPEPLPLPELILVDIGLPDINGLDLIPKVRSLSPQTKIIVLTVYEDDEKIFRAVCAGASGYLLKGSSANDIVLSVREALSGGSPMSPKIAHRVLDLFAHFAPQQNDYGLSEREQEILRLIVAGRTNKELASELDLSIHTVDTYLRRIYAKLEVHNRSGAVAKAFREKLT